MKWLLSLLLIDSSTTSKEGNGGQQMSAELLNKAFSTKSTQFRYWNCHEKPNGTLFSTYKQVHVHVVCVYVAASAHTHTEWLPYPGFHLGGGSCPPHWKLAAPLENSHKPYTQYKKFEWRKCPFLLLFNTNYFQLCAPCRRKHTVLKGRGTNRYHWQDRSHKPPETVLEVKNVNFSWGSMPQTP